jgi:hypothetical protein
MKPLQERSVPELLKLQEKMMKREHDICMERSLIEQELRTRGWHLNYDYGKRKYIWKPRLPETYDQYRMRVRKEESEQRALLLGDSTTKERRCGNERPDPSARDRRRAQDRDAHR